MKNRLLAFMAAVLFGIGTSLSASEIYCTVSSDADENFGVCRALSSGNQEMCFSFGVGPACSGEKILNPHVN